MSKQMAEKKFDVLIGGGGLAGLTLSLQLIQEFPDYSIGVIEQTTRPLPEACHKVGESSVELGSHYLESLGLKDYLATEHLFKHGLRFYPGGGHLPINERRELGPAREPVVPSYQIDRGKFENDVREIVDESGVTLLEGYKIEDVDLGSDGAVHAVDIAGADGVSERLSSRWFFDASGRNALLRRKLKLTRGTRHAANAGWFRVEGNVDITALVEDSETEWHKAEFAGDRWRSTNHLMGTGYWVWIIPLSTGHTSIGLVVHDEEHGYQVVRSLPNVRAFMEKHEPWFAKRIFAWEVLDFRSIRNYSHNVARSFSTDRWGMVGEAGAFVDPLYSPGTDYIAYANTFARELMRVERDGGDLERRTRELNLQYRALVSGNVDLFRDAAPVYGHPSAMFMKLYWDNFSYWSFPCQYFFQEIYRETGEAHQRFAVAGMRFVELSRYLQQLTRAWALTCPEEPDAGFGDMPGFPSVLIDAHLALQESMSPDETYEYMLMRIGEGEQIVAECLVRVLFEVGDEKCAAVFDSAGVSRWDLSVEARRLVAEATIGLARRRALTPLERDVERTLGRVKSESHVETVSGLLAPLLVAAQNERGVAASQQ